MPFFLALIDFFSTHVSSNAHSRLHELRSVNGQSLLPSTLKGSMQHPTPSKNAHDGLHSLSVMLTIERKGQTRLFIVFKQSRHPCAGFLGYLGYLHMLGGFLSDGVSDNLKRFYIAVDGSFYDA